MAITKKLKKNKKRNYISIENNRYYGSNIYSINSN